jgi:cell division protein FtsX
VLTVLEQTPGVESARAMTDAEQRALLEPWFGPDLPVGGSADAAPDRDHRDARGATMPPA